MSFPYRIILNKDRNFKLDYNIKYSEKYYSIPGIRYIFKNSLPSREFLDTPYIHSVELIPKSLTYLDKPPDNNKILVLSTLDEILKFNKIYKETNIITYIITSKNRPFVKKDEVIKRNVINWDKVCKLYGGIEF